MSTVAEKSEQHNGFSPRTGFFGIIPHWVLRLKLTCSEYQTLLAIACHADKARCARGWSVETIASDAGLDRGKVQRAIRGLKKKGVVQITPGGGRGHPNEYQIIFEPAASPPVDDRQVDPQNSVAGDADLNGVNGDAASEKTASISAQNSVAGAPSSESEQKERTPPSGESHARARGEDFSNDEFDRRQGALLLPFNCRVDRWSLLKKYNPSAALVDLAREQYGINALDDRVLSEFIDWHIEHNKLPSDIEAIEAAYRRWIRRERRFAEQSRHRPQQRSNAGETETAAAAEFFERTRAMRANGAVQ